MTAGHAPHTRTWIALAAIALIAACVSEENKRDGINAINVVFKREYEATLTRNGARVLPASPGEAFDAVYAAFVKQGLVVRQQSPALGFISAEAPAPVPLSRDEWDRATAADLPGTRELLRQYLGPLAEFFHFEAEGVDIVVTATIIGVRGGSEISFTMRLREVAPPKQNLPRRDYPLPTALKMGLDKLWAAVERELAASSRKP